MFGVRNRTEVPKCIRRRRRTKVFAAGDEFGPVAERDPFVTSLPEPKQMILVDAQDHFLRGGFGKTRGRNCRADRGIERLSTTGLRIHRPASALGTAYAAFRSWPRCKPNLSVLCDGLWSRVTAPAET